MQKNLKRTWRIVLALILILLPPAGRAAEDAKPTGDAKSAVEAKAPEAKPEEDKVTGEVAASVLSAYIWRGQELTRHAMVVQPSVTASYKGFSANVWGNLDTKPYAAGNENHSSAWTETDVTLSYARKFGIVQATAGYIYYGLAAPYAGGFDPQDAQELFVSLGLDTLLSPTLTVYKEIDHYHQWYATLGASHTFALHEKIGLKLAGSVSYLKSEDASTYPKFNASAVATTDKFSNFHDGMLSVMLPVAVTKNITITPLVTYVFPLSDDAKYEMRARSIKGAQDPGDKDSSFIYGGITLSFAF